MQYTISRSSRRRTISIRIQRGQVKVMAPERTPDPVVRSFVESKQHWIARHVHKQQSGLSGLAARQWKHGETLWLFGRPLTLHIHRATTSRIIFNQHQL